jgi:hypothetical protein
MHPKTHANLMNMCGYAVLVIIPLIFILGCILSGSSLSEGSFILPSLFVPIMLVIYLILRYIPIYCDKSGCNGRMMVTKTRIGYTTVLYKYQCPICKYVYQADAFEMKSGRGHGGGGK